MSLKTINATVGIVGANIPADVATVQYLLNCVPFSQGGPQQELYVDGIAAETTIQAIKRFQQFHLGQASGQISANEITLNMLKKFDPLPSKAWVVPPDFTPTPFDISNANTANNVSLKIDTIKGKTGNVSLKIDTIKGKPSNISHEGIKRGMGNISAIDTHIKRGAGNISLKIDTIKGKTWR